MSTEALLRQAVRGALAVGAAGSMVGAGAALAQTAPASGTSTGGTRLSQIVVTGSHIPQTSIATAQPVLTINRSQIEATGFTTVGQLLQNLTQSGSALNEQFNNGGNGSEQINLHQLGSQRVLVLVNGQRWLPTLGNAVDLTTIPTAIVQRVEVLLDGASAIYGSEAMAGVVNVITEKNFNGAKVNAYGGIYDASSGADGGGWDGKTQQFDFTVGTSNDRSSVLLSAGYYEQNPVWASNRSISKEPIVGYGGITGSSGTPGGRFLFLTHGATNPYGPSSGQPGCFALTGTTTPTPGPGTFGLCDIAGPITGPNANAHPWSNADRFNYAPANYLRTPEEQYYTYAQGHYDLSDNVSFHFTTEYLRRNSHQVLAPNPWFFGVYGYLANGLPIGISGTQKYNPFGVDLVPFYTGSPGEAQWCSLYGTGATPGTCTTNYDNLLLLGRRPLEVGNRDFQQNKDTFYFNGGFTGYFMMAGNQWQWNVDYDYGDTLNTQITAGLANTARIQAALGPNAACTGSCVPLDLFGGAAAHTITPAMGNYVQFTAHDVTDNVLRDYNANLSGNFFNSWYAGAWGVAAGYEYEEHDGYFSPDPLISTGNTVGNVATATNGKENTNAQYIEMNIPLASNVTFAKQLDLDVANRWSQFKWAGVSNFIDTTTVPPSINTGPAVGKAHASTARATLKWQPIQSLLLRATWSQGFRIPSLNELFAGAGTNYPAATDPCATPSGTLAPIAQSCLGANQPNSQIQATSGGNVALSPEKSTNRSIGFVYSPDFAPGLDISADYFKVEVDNVISQLGAQFYLDACYYGGIQQYCNNVVRGGGTFSTGAVSNIINLTTNAGMLKSEGWDFGIKYQLPTTAAGDFTVGLTGTFYKSVVFCNQPSKFVGTPPVGVSDCSEESGSVTGGFSGTPKHLFNFDVGWNYGPWGAVWRMNIIGPMYEICSDTALPQYGVSLNTSWCDNPTFHQPQYFGSGTGIRRLGTTVYNNVQASYTVSSWNTTFTLGINNILDKRPPVSYTAFANSYLPNYYQTPGRFIYGRVSISF